MTVTLGQVDFERKHLLKKLKVRDPILYKEMSKRKRLASHPLFQKIRGTIASWERS
jgi:hypothetical protein